FGLLLALHKLPRDPPAPELVLEPLAILFVLQRARRLASGLQDRVADGLGHVLREFRAPVGERDRDAFLTVAGEDEAVAALVGMDSPHSDLRIEEVRLEDDEEILLDLRVGDAEPPEVRL